MVNWTLIVCGIAGMIGAGIFWYLTNSYLPKPLETSDSEHWNTIYALVMGFGSLGLFLIGVFKKR